MFERFTDRSITVIIAAQGEARRLKQSVVGTELILLGLVLEDKGPAVTLLAQAGITSDNVRSQVEELLAERRGRTPTEIPFTPKAKMILEQAVALSQELQTDRIDPEHLLLSLTQDDDNEARHILENLGADLDQLAAELLKQLRQPVAVAATKDPTPAFSPRSRGHSTLSEFGINLTERAKSGALDPLVGRQRELDRVIQILGRRTKNNPVLLGEPGVGKTAVAEGLAQRIVDGTIPADLRDKQVISLNMAALVSGTQMRGAFEERLTHLVQEVQQDPSIILFLDELHTLVGAGSMQGGIDAANILKPALARGELQCIGATTLAEYRQHIEKDAALERRFQPVQVGEPSVSETIEILFGLRSRYEDHHQLSISDPALVAAAQLADRYIADRFLPDKAIDLIDEAGSRVRVRQAMQSPTRQLKHQLQSVIRAKEAAVECQDFEKASQLRDQELALEQQIKDLKAKERAQAPAVQVEDIAQVVEAWTGIPVNQLTETESRMLMHLEETLHQRVIGQDEAVSAVARAIRRSRIDLRDPDRPLGSFIFMGPTGVGKTELAKALASSLFGSEESMIRLDMSEYMEPHTVSKLIGSPPGYVGYGEGGKLTEAVRRRPYTVVLLDEIEKAHPDVFNLLLQLLEDGHLTDAQGRKVSFKNTLIILTSNVGARLLEKGSAGFGFDTLADQDPQSQYRAMRERVREELQQVFRPEFLNRLDDIIVFRALNREELQQVADLLLREITDRLENQQQIHLTVTTAGKDYLVSQGYDPTYGARPLRRTLMRLVEDPLAEALLRGDIHPGEQVTLDMEAEQGLVIRSELSRQLVAATA
jgi:ATP-dependent Clp protease ATP-binding subunit ClpC